MAEHADAYPIQDDMAYQRRSWAVERTAWTVLALLAAAAAFGLLSHGPLSRTTAIAADSRLSVSYERLERRQASSQFTIRAAGLVKDGESILRFGPAFLATYEIRTMSPPPVRASAGANGFEARFAASASGDVEVHLTARAKRLGFARFTVEAPELGAIEVHQFVFP